MDSARSKEKEEEEETSLEKFQELIKVQNLFSFAPRQFCWAYKIIVSLTKLWRIVISHGMEYSWQRKETFDQLDPEIFQILFRWHLFLSRTEPQWEMRLVKIGLKAFKLCFDLKIGLLSSSVGAINSLRQPRKLVIL